MASKTTRTAIMIPNIVQDAGWAAGQELVMYPIDVLVDGLRAATGQVVVLGQVLAQHPPAERRVVPGDLVGAGPG